MQSFFNTTCRFLTRTTGNYRGLHHKARFAFSTNKNYYEVLGLSQNADQKQIKSAFYKLAKQYHPDINKGTEDKFKQVNEAFEVLSDDGKKQQYDNQLKYGNTGGFGDNYGQSYGGQQQNSGQHYHYGWGPRYTSNQQRQNQQQQQQQYTYHYTYTDAKGKKRTYTRTEQRNMDEDFDSFFKQFTREFGGRSSSDDFRKKVYEDIRKQQQEWVNEQKESQEFQDLRAAMKRKMLKFLGVSMLIVFLLSGSSKQNQYVVYDENSNAGYVTDEKTYNEWMRKGQPPAANYFQKKPEYTKGQPPVGSFSNFNQM